jgi:hypothetical protein
MLANTRIGALIDTLSKVNDALLWQNAGNENEIKETIKDIQQEQLSRGERPDGSNFPDYSDTSVFVYGKQAGPIVWYDDGEMYDRIKPQFTPDEIDMGQALTTGDDNEELDLEIEYNEQILGIQEGNIAAIQEQVKASYIEQLRWFLDGY